MRDVVDDKTTACNSELHILSPSCYAEDLLSPKCIGRLGYNAGQAVSNVEGNAGNGEEALPSASG
ncbi:hypothetical protein RRF57_009558 [Xylaria bambusicola]|uniref:Uncharacterized protein n=1 Tax=Xylaria bambusicola TaxID=326684 RepID=A0AAN7V2R6_9PEZI